VEDRIHLLTGRTPKSPAASRWADYRDVDFHQVLDVRTGSWSHAAPAPAPRNSATAGVIDGRLYIAGGRTMDGGNMARLDMYDPQTDRWQSLRPMPAPAGGLAGAVFAGELYVFGGEELGREDAGGVIAGSWKYSPARDAWTALPDMPTPRHGLAAVALENRILLAGGGALPATGRTMTTVESFRPG
jgi:N-acetylneuraminic acid mutarotase